MVNCSKMPLLKAKLRYWIAYIENASFTQFCPSQTPWNFAELSKFIVAQLNVVKLYKLPNIIIDDSTDEDNGSIEMGWG